MLLASLGEKLKTFFETGNNLYIVIAIAVAVVALIIIVVVSAPRKKKAKETTSGVDGDKDTTDSSELGSKNAVGLANETVEVTADAAKAEPIAVVEEAKADTKKAKVEPVEEKTTAKSAKAEPIAVAEEAKADTKKAKAEPVEEKATAKSAKAEPIAVAEEAKADTKKAKAESVEEKATAKSAKAEPIAVAEEAKADTKKAKTETVAEPTAVFENESSEPTDEDEHETRPGTVEIYKNSAGAFHFRFRAINGSIVGHSQSYTTKESCKNGIRSVITTCETVEIEDTTKRTNDYVQTIGKAAFEIYRDNAEQFRFRLVARNATNILASQGYTAKTNCINGANSIMRMSKNHVIDDQTLVRKKKDVK